MSGRVTSAGRRWRRIWRWLLTAVIVLVLLAVCLFIYWRASLERQSQIMQAMNVLTAWEYYFSNERFVDMDGDGIGEFGFLGELLANFGYSARNDPAIPGIRLLPISSEDANSSGIAEYMGYYLTIYLPTADDTGIRAYSHGKGSPPADADPQESRFIIYAWPVRLGLLTRVALAMDTPIKPWITLNAGEQEYEGLQRIPPPKAALRAGEDRTPNPSAGDVRITGSDGFTWFYVGP